MQSVQNKTAIVTGAATGIGKDVAQLFARKGMKVVASDINEEHLNRVVAEIQSEGLQAEAFAADVSDEKQIQDLISFTADTFGSIDIVVNNAGIMDNFMPVTEVQPDQWKKIMDVNLSSIYFMCHHVLPQMLQSGSGNIINVSSVGGLGGGKAGAAYTASKHAVIGLSKNIAYMYAPQGIRCNVIAPGGVETSISETMKPSRFGYERVALGTASVPRMGKPEEIAQLALFLASDESAFINGVTVTADGGWTAY